MSCSKGVCVKCGDGDADSPEAAEKHIQLSVN